MTKITLQDRKIITNLHHMLLLVFELSEAIPYESRFNIEEGFVYKFDKKLDHYQRRAIREALSLITNILKELGYRTNYEIYSDEIRMRWEKKYKTKTHNNT